MPQAPSPAFAGQVQELGKSFIEGHEVDGQRFIYHPPGQPNAPTIADTEVWTSTKLGLPVVTKITGSFGRQICRCKFTEAGEPPAALFQAPADYKQPELHVPPKPPGGIR